MCTTKAVVVCCSSNTVTRGQREPQSSSQTGNLSAPESCHPLPSCGHVISGARQDQADDLSQLGNAKLQPLVQVFDLNHYPPADMPLSVEPARPGKELSQRINALVEELRQGSETWQTCFVIRQGEAALPCHPPRVKPSLYRP